MQGSERRPHVPSRRAVYQHPWVVRFAHWLNAVSVSVLAMSGLQIFQAFPSVGDKVPQTDLITAVPAAITLGGWLGGALQWHFTFMWIFTGTADLYAIYQGTSGHYRAVIFLPRDVPHVWPMVRHDVLWGPKPRTTEQYNALQKLAYSAVIGLGAISMLTGVVMHKPVQFSGLGALFGGYRWARLVHFVAMCGLLSFLPGHLLMVAIHGWDNCASMFTGWKQHPDYDSEPGRLPR